MSGSKQKLRMILKFDTGADGFMKMIYVLAVMSVVTLVCGWSFLSIFWREFYKRF